VNNKKSLPHVIPLHPHKNIIKIKIKIKMDVKIKMNMMIKFKRRAMIKGAMRMMGMKMEVTQDLHHHTQECATPFKGIAREQHS
jgi:hypothetical protein